MNIEVHTDGDGRAVNRSGGWSFGDGLVCGMLSVDYIMGHHFSRHDDGREFVFVWTCRQPKYCPVYHDFFVLADGRLWPVLTSLDLLDGYSACIRACLDGLFRDDSACSAWHAEYAECERRILGRN